VSHDQLWRKLYAYRSAIAHGDRPDFAKELAVLRDTDAVHRYLSDLIAQLLEVALREPLLVGDLREC
jgi:hypothetical protein